MLDERACGVDEALVGAAKAVLLVSSPCAKRGGRLGGG